MAPNVEPVFVKSPRLEVVRLTDEVAAFDPGSATPKLIFTAGENGTLITGISWWDKAGASPTVNQVVNFYVLSNGAYQGFWSGRIPISNNNPPYADVVSGFPSLINEGIVPLPRSVIRSPEFGFSGDATVTRYADGPYRDIWLAPEQTLYAAIETARPEGFDLIIAGADY